MDFISEDSIVNYVEQRGGLLITRKKINIENFDFDTTEPFFVVMTGYKNVLSSFFDNIIQKIKTSIVIILIETDKIDITIDQVNDSKIKQIYCWNKPFQHPKLTCIPIGINHQRQHAVLSHWLENNEPTHSKLMCINYSPDTNKVRKNLINYAINNWMDFCDVIDFIPPTEIKKEHSNTDRYGIRVPITDAKCYDVMSEYKFVLSPPGAGEDCHRTWEALYTGCVPIVQMSGLHELYTNLPVLVMDNFENITEEYLLEKWDEIQRKKDLFIKEKITMKYWIRKFEVSLQRPIIHFMTYANEVFETARERLVKEASEFGVFETIQGYTPNNLPKLFREKYENILTQQRGGGFWMWRPVILSDKMRKVNYGDYVVYLDAGCQLNNQGKRRFFEYIELLHESEYGILSFQMDNQKEKVWTTGEIFKFLNEDPESNIGNSGQYLGGVMILKKNTHSLDFIRKTIDVIFTDPLLITDHYNGNDQHPDFQDNRHDQSITSILRKQMGSIVIPTDESWKPPFGQGESLKYPFWATRSKK